MKSMKAYAGIPEYIAGSPKETQKLLHQMRTTIKKAAPKAEEAIRYGIPTFRLNGNLVHFGGFKKHIGFFPGPRAIQAFAKDLKKYTTTKGTIQLPLDEPLNPALITKIVKFRVKENMAKSKPAEKTCSRGHTYTGAEPCPLCWPGGAKKRAAAKHTKKD